MSRRRQTPPPAEKYIERPTAGEGCSPLNKRRKWALPAIGALIPIIAFILFASNGTFERSGDARGLAHLSNLLASGELPRLGLVPAYQSANLGYEAFRRDDGFVGSFFPPGVSLLHAPAFFVVRRVASPPVAGNVLYEAKFAASLMMAILCLALWMGLLQKFGVSAASLAVVLFASGSVAWPHFSQGMWNQGGALFCQGAALCAVAWWMTYSQGESARARRDAIVLGIVSGFFATYAPFCRPTFAVWWLPFLGFVVLAFRWKSWPFLIGAVPALVAGFWINVQATGSWFGHYAQSHGSSTLGISYARWREALPALLFSPSRGLLLYCPWIAISLFGAVIAFFERSPWRWLQAINLFFCVAVLLVVSSFEHYWGGSSHGPRLQSDMLVCALFLAAPGLAWLAGRWWGLLIVVILWLPSAIVFRQASEMLHYRWESAERGHRHRLWYWEKGLYNWYWTAGANERIIKNRVGQPREGVKQLRGNSPEVENYIINGVEAKGAILQLTGRLARFQFITDVATSGLECYLVVRFVDDTSMRGRTRKVEAIVNGKSLGTASHDVASGRQPILVYLIPEGLIGKDLLDIVALHERRPPQTERGDMLLPITELSIVPRGPVEMRNQLLEELLSQR